ncbi:MAG TPA: hypothetical protein VKP65_22585 [Rhodothermales bacterium]|nr:hypothetical protein [Rhodothermales bacterium]
MHHAFLPPLAKSHNPFGNTRSRLAKEEEGHVQQTGAFAAKSNHGSSANGYRTIQAPQIEFKPLAKKQYQNNAPTKYFTSPLNAKKETILNC